MDFIKLNPKISKIITSFLICISFGIKSYSQDLSLKDHLKITAEDSLDSTGLWILGAGAAATLLAFQFDQHTHDLWKDHQQMSADLSKYGDFWGSGIPEVIIIAGQMYYDSENGKAALEGLTVGTLVTHSSKYLIGRERPNSTTRTSMPSGHSQAAFSLAASITESYGWKTGLPFWGMAAFTGLSRLADNAHWLSDVVAGATIGALFGRASYSHHRQIQPLVLFNQGQVEGASVALKIDW